MHDTNDIATIILEKNRVCCDAMIKLVATKEAIAFVGAGLSQPLG